MARRVYVHEANVRSDQYNNRVSECTDQPHDSVRNSLKFGRFSVVFGPDANESQYL